MATGLHNSPPSPSRPGRLWAAFRDSLRAGPDGAAPAHQPDVNSTSPAVGLAGNPNARSSRRSVLLAAVSGAAGLMTARFANPSHAPAANNDPLLAGHDYQGTLRPSPQNTTG